MTDKPDLVRSPLNFTGSKFKYMRILLKYMPDRIRIFEDWFAGGGNVYANIWPNKTVIQVRAMEKDAGLMALLVAMSYQEPYQFIKEVEEVIKENGLTRSDKKGYYEFRDKLNSKELSLNAARFMALVAHSYNNMIRWNCKGEYNVPFGKRYFNPRMKDNTFAFVNRLTNIPHLSYLCRDFRRYNTRHLTSDDLVFCDPPYLISTAAYNSAWTEKDDHDLYCKLDIVDVRGGKFMLINALEHKGKRNEILEEWSKKYSVVDVWGDYAGGYAATRKSKGQTQEILVMNYELEEGQEND